MGLNLRIISASTAFGFLLAAAFTQVRVGPCSSAMFTWTTRSRVYAVFKLSKAGSRESCKHSAEPGGPLSNIPSRKLWKREEVSLLEMAVRLGNDDAAGWLVESTTSRIRFFGSLDGIENSWWHIWYLPIRGGELRQLEELGSACWRSACVVD